MSIYNRMRSDRLSTGRKLPPLYLYGLLIIIRANYSPAIVMTMISWYLMSAFTSMIVMSILYIGMKAYSLSFWQAIYLMC
jgi:hypothetical protein